MSKVLSIFGWSKYSSLEFFQASFPYEYQAFSGFDG